MEMFSSRSARTLIAVLVIGGFLTLFFISSTIRYPLFQSDEALLARFDDEKLTADAALVEVLATGETLFARNADSEYPIASITKLFTAYAVIHSPLIESETQIVWQDFSTEGTAGSLWLGETYTLRELLFPLLLSSSNDAGAAILRMLGKRAFDVELEKLYEDAGLSHTVIADTTGLTAKNHSTARELAVFIAYLDTHDRYLLDITELHSSVGPNGYGWINNNPGREYDTFKGGKHGYTPAAGRTFAGIFAGNDGEKYAVILLGSDNLSTDLAEIIKILPKNIVWSTP